VHLLGCADNGIDWTCLNAEGAANTGFGVNQSYWPWPLDAAFGFQLKVGRKLPPGHHQNRAQALYSLGAPRRAAVGQHPLIGHCRSIGSAVGVTALRALGLRQNIIELIAKFNWIHAMFIRNR
jgi:hypothetical protein